MIGTTNYIHDEVGNLISIKVLSSAIYWVIGRYSDNVKISGLRHATAKADSTIQVASRYFSEASTVAVRALTARFAKILQKELRLLTENGLTKPRMDRAVDAAKKFDKILRARPARVFQQLANAHNALTRSLNEQNVSLSQLFAQIEHFATSAQELAKTAKDFAELGNG